MFQYVLRLQPRASFRYAWIHRCTQKLKDFLMCPCSLYWQRKFRHQNADSFSMLSRIDDTLIRGYNSNSVKVWCHCTSKLITLDENIRLCSQMGFQTDFERDFSIRHTLDVIGSDNKCKQNDWKWGLHVSLLSWSPSKSGFCVHLLQMPWRQSSHNDTQKKTHTHACFLISTVVYQNWQLTTVYKIIG